jgi:hypothetical protein
MHLQGNLEETEDAKKGVRAFIEKRAASGIGLASPSLPRNRGLICPWSPQGATKQRLTDCE